METWKPQTRNMEENAVGQKGLELGSQNEAHS